MKILNVLLFLFSTAMAFHHGGRHEWMMCGFQTAMALWCYRDMLKETK